MDFAEIIQTSISNDNLAFFVIIMLFYVLLTYLKELSNNLYNISTIVSLLEDNMKDMQHDIERRKK